MSKNEKFYFTVGELIDILKDFPSAMPVLVSGYKSGYENFFHPHVVKLIHEPENMYFEGEFQIPENDKNGEFEAIVLDMVCRDD